MTKVSELAKKVRSQRSGVVVPGTGKHNGTPWDEATPNAEYHGLDGSVWMYRVVENVPLRYDDPEAVLDHGKGMVRLISEIGSSSIAAPSRFVEAPSGWYREMHVLAVRWEERPAVPSDTRTREHASWLERDVFSTFDAPQQLMFVGVKLSDIDGKTASRAENPLDLAKFYVDRWFNDRPADFDLFDEDRKWVNSVLLNRGCRMPTETELRWLEGWWNNGSHTEPTVLPFEDHLLIGPERERLEFAALARTTDEGKVLRAPYREWLADVLDHRDGPQAVSLRFELMPPQDVRKALRRSVAQREQEEDEARKHGVMDKVEEQQEHHLTRYAETQYASRDAGPALKDLSVVFGKRDRGRHNESWSDYLRDNYGMITQPLTHRQIQALEEVQPCAQKRGNPFKRAMNVNALGYSGLGMFTNLGDPSGVFLGLGLPEGVPSFLDFRRNTEDRKVPPVTFVSGVPGSGKTFMSLSMAFQACLSGLDVNFVNPKGESTLAQVLPFFQSHGIECEWTAVSQLLRDDALGVGMYDPFRYARYPETAADLAATLITTVVDLPTQEMRGELRHGLLRGAKAGAGSSMRALEYVNDAEVVRAVKTMWESQPLFRLGLADNPQPRVRPAEDGYRVPRPGRFTLTEFDLPLQLPTTVKDSYTDPERNALAAVHAVTSASIGMLSAGNGGVYMMDEAHNVLAHPELVHHVQKVAREGRSLGVAQVYISQQVSDLMSVTGAGGREGSMRSYISRVIALQMTDEHEAAAALQLMGLEPQRERIEDMRSFKPQQAADGSYTPALGYFQDIEGRTTIMQFGPYGHDFTQAVDSKISREQLHHMFAANKKGQ